VIGDLEWLAGAQRRWPPCCIVYRAYISSDATSHQECENLGLEQRHGNGG